MNPLAPKAFIYEFNKVSEEQEIFLGLINFSEFKELGLDETNINTDTSCRLVYLTRSKDHTQDAIKVWVNLLLVDPYGKIPHIAHFRSQKIFWYSQEEKYQDIFQGTLVYRQDKMLHIMT